MNLPDFPLPDEFIKQAALLIAKHPGQSDFKSQTPGMQAAYLRTLTPRAWRRLQRAGFIS